MQTSSRQTHGNSCRRGYACTGHAYDVLRLDDRLDCIYELLMIVLVAVLRLQGRL